MLVSKWTFLSARIHFIIIIFHHQAEARAHALILKCIHPASPLHNSNNNNIMLNNNNALSIYCWWRGDIRAYVLMAYGRLHPKIIPSVSAWRLCASVMPWWVSDSRPWRPPLCLNTTLQGIWFLITLQTQINACIELWLMRRHFPRFFPGTTPRAMKAANWGPK